MDYIRLNPDNLLNEIKEDVKEDPEEDLSVVDFQDFSPENEVIITSDEQSRLNWLSSLVDQGDTRTYKRLKSFD